ncbi:exonuclease mut-7 homolog isoform X2 [Neoarius graeffei]|uniref:exonuclease mut-7 homolog isoform X2 n=1 Tax=Neoarius graeffei TaxID=443677 RepID=UPI00298CC3AB|nr:exonuclease mut-7 homolog isoform X2 [Neoarius graeffei]
MNQTLRSDGGDPAVLREQLCDLWSRKELELRRQAVSGFSQFRSPLAGLLTLLDGCPGVQKSRSTSLGQFLLTEFVRWRRGRVQVSLKELEDEEEKRNLQLRALELITTSQPGYMDLLLEIYELKNLEKNLLLEHVTLLQNSHCFREAALLCMKLGFQEELDMEQVCVPLILMDKLPLAEAYVQGHADLQECLVRLLDSWCSPDFNLENLRRQFPCLSLSKHQTDQIQPKLLIRHIFRLMEKFSIDPGVCVNAVYKRKLDSLRFLMYKRFGEKNMSEENWRDHVQVTVEGSVDLQVVLVELLVKYCGLKAAAQWAKHYSVPRDRLPFGVRDTMETLSSSQLEINEVFSPLDRWITPPSHQLQFYQLPVNQQHVHMVENAEQLQLCRDSVLQTGGVVGVDMEWRAGFGTVSTQRISLIQLAVKEQVFLLDLCAPGLSHHSLTINFIRTLLTDTSVLKLGYGMSGDLRSLVATWPELKEEPLEFKGVLDLLHVHQQLQRCWRGRAGPRPMEVNEGPAEKGLSLLVQQVLGKPLDKTEQLSNWERRPLRTGQVRYAAIDAYCLVDVYLTLSADPKAFGLPDDLHSIKPSSSTKSDSNKKTKEKRKQTGRKARQSASGCVGDQDECVRGEGEQYGASITPQELRVVCDNMLQGLGRYLRCVGVDVLMLENTDDHRVAAQIARNEGRIILTSGQPFQTLRSQVAEGRCLTLDCSEKARDQALHVLKHFNVHLTPSDIFSRCQACNNDEYLKLPREDMTQMMNKRGLIQHLVLKRDDCEAPCDAQVDYNRWRPLEGPAFTPHCRWAPRSALDTQSCRFRGGAKVQLETVPPGLLPRIPEYFICTRCGKVFWEGTHFDRALSQFQDVLNFSDDDMMPRKH